MAVGHVALPLVLLGLILLRGPDGIVWIFLLLVLVFVNDIGALYAGLYLGPAQAYALGQPGKDDRGIGRRDGAACLSGRFSSIFLAGFPGGQPSASFSTVGVAGPVGDLFESVLKRSGKIKDSGLLLPGHGGILDRIDALLFAAPVAYYYRMYVF